MGARGPKLGDSAPYKGLFWIAIYRKDDSMGEQFCALFTSVGAFDRWLTGVSPLDDKARQAGRSVLASAWRYLTGRPFPYKKNGVIARNGRHYLIYFIAIDDKDFDVYLDKDAEKIYNALFPESRWMQTKKREEKRKS